MKKIIFKSSIIFLLITFALITYLSVIGIKTTRLNNQIGILIENFNKDLKIELKDVKIILNPIKFELQAKTLGPKFIAREKIIELENIKTKISINSLIKDDFSLKNLEISTKALELENLISFLRQVKNSPELFILEKIFKKGYLISDIKIEFNDKGKIKNNYKINGFIKDAKIKLSKNFDFEKIDLIFKLENELFKFNDINFKINNTQFYSEQIQVKNMSNNFLIEGLVTNKNLSLNDEIVESFVKSYLSKLSLKNIMFDSKNEFSFEINKKFKIDKLKFSSEIKLNNLKLTNKLNLKKFLPNVKDEINFNDHIINIIYDKKNITIEGSGKILSQNENDLVNYKLKKKNEFINFETNLIVEKNPLLIDFLGYNKKSEIKANLKLKGIYVDRKKILIESFSLDENKNKFKIDKLVLDKKFKIIEFKKIDLDYVDIETRQNKINIIKEKNKYILNGPKFNANSLIEKLINNDDSKNSEIFNQNIYLNINIDQVFLDKEHKINNLIGRLDYKKNEISNAELNAFFSKDKKFKFTVKSTPQEKVTTLYLDEAKPIVKRYKFIKGFNNGSLDFYSSKKDGKSNSNLKIYNFRLKELPVLTKLLTLASLQGIADILSGEGITFDEFEMNFDNKNDLMTIHELYAIGPAISILIDGYVEKKKLVSLRGSLVPATTINKVIGNIPVLGKILVGSKTGEGVFGVSFKIKGPPKNLETTVNPIKTLTPRFITRTLEKIKKN